MKTIKLTSIVIGLLVLGNAASSFGANLVGAEWRYHGGHSYSEDIPYGGGDSSFGIGYEFREGTGAWQIGVNYASSLSDGKYTNVYGEVDSVITPYMNLVLQDGIFMAGLGALGSYVKTKNDDHDNEWTDIYWQFILGIDYPVTPRMNIAANAYYPFYRWSDLDEFKFEDLDFGIRLSFKF